MSHSYRQLLVWQKARSFAGAVYRTTEKFPKSEMYGLSSQVRRAAVSVSCNIAEGQGRLTKGEFRHFLGQARGSLLEVETQLDVASDLGYLDRGSHDALQQYAYEILGLLNRLIAALRSPAPTSETCETLKPAKL